jgi:hypothetical protein
MTIPLEIARGKTLRFRMQTANGEKKLYTPITGMPSTAPVRLTAPNHGIPDDWPIQIACVKTPQELNTAPGVNLPVIVVDENTIELNAINAHCWKPYSGGGLIVWPEPADLTDAIIRGTVRDKVGGNILFRWHSDPAQPHDGLIVIDPSGYDLTATDEVTAALTWKKGVYDVECEIAGEVYSLVPISPVTVIDELTT